MADKVKLYILAASLVKTEPGRTVSSLMQGYRVCASEDEAKGAFATAALEAKPGFAISDLLCMTVPDAAINPLGLSQIGSGE